MTTFAEFEARIADFVDSVSDAAFAAQDYTHDKEGKALNGKGILYTGTLNGQNAYLIAEGLSADSSHYYISSTAASDYKDKRLIALNDLKNDIDASNLSASQKAMLAGQILDDVGENPANKFDKLVSKNLAQSMIGDILVLAGERVDDEGILETIELREILDGRTGVTKINGVDVAVWKLISDNDGVALKHQIRKVIKEGVLPHLNDISEIDSDAGRALLVEATRGLVERELKGITSSGGLLDEPDAAKTYAEFDGLDAKTIAGLAGFTFATVEFVQSLDDLAEAAETRGVEGFLEELQIQARWWGAGLVVAVLAVTFAPATAAVVGTGLSIVSVGQLVGQMIDDEPGDPLSDLAGNVETVLTLLIDQYHEGLNVAQTNPPSGPVPEHVSDQIVSGRVYRGFIDQDNIDLTLDTFDPYGIAFGDDETDYIQGNDADNNLYGGLGDDTIDGGAGNDLIAGDNLSDSANGGRDVLLGGDGNDQIDGGANDDELYGNAGDDLLIGGEGYDRLEGGEGNDLLNGGAGQDVLLGGAGDDLLWGGDGQDVIDGGAGQDGVDYSQSPDSRYSVTLNATNGTVPNGVSPTAWSLYVEKIQPDLVSDEIYNVESVILGSSDDEVKIVSPVAAATELIIDMGEGADLIDVSGLSEGVEINLRNPNGQSINLHSGTGILTVKNAEMVKGSNHDDKIYAGNISGAEIDGGAGNDVIVGNSRGWSTLLGGAGNDTIQARSSGTIVRTGDDAGEDKVLLDSDNVLVTDADSNDSFYLYDELIELTGGVKFATSESPWAVGSALTRFAINEVGDLVVEDLLDRQSFIANYNGGPGVANPTGGIQVGEIILQFYRLMDPNYPGMQLEGLSDALDLLWKAMFGEPRRPGADPLVLDLDGDGLELTAQTIVSPSFDLDGDGFAELTGWVSSDDGFLARDLNANGTIDDVSELFGNQTIDGFTELATLDSNTDGVIDASDAEFGTLRIWRDLDQDGVTDAGELQTLAEAGIASIGLATTATDTLNANNQITATGSFTRTDATTGEIADVVFRIDNFRSTYLGDSTVSAAAAALPELKGRGTLPNLRIAMTQDAALLSVVTATLPLLNVIDLPALRDAATPIFTAWAGPSVASYRDVPLLAHVDASGSTVIDDFGIYDGATGAWSLASGRVITDTNGDPIVTPTIADIMALDPQGNEWRVFEGHHIAFMEKFLGEPVPIDQATQTDSAAIAAVGGYLTQLVEFLDLLTVRLALQGPLSTYLVDLEYDVDADSFKPTTDRQLIPTFEAIYTAMPADQTGAEAWLASWKPIIDIVLGDYDRGESYLLTSYSFIFANIVAASESIGGVLGAVAAAEAFGIPQGLIIDGTGVQAGTGENDIFYLNAGDETASGGGGHDAYVVGRNFGTDVIDDVETSGRASDLIRFADIAVSEVTATRNGLDLIITVDATGDQLTVKNQFHGNIPGLLGGDLFPDMGVGEITFADGVVWDRIEIAKQAAKPLATDDTLTGSYGFDVLDGGAGTDFLSGGDDSDMYLFGIGYGHDTIEDNIVHFNVNNPDFLVFGAGITWDDLIFTRNGNSDDVDIAIAGTTDYVTLVSQFDRGYTGIFDDAWLDRIEVLAFDDGSTMFWEDIITSLHAAAKTDGDDTIYGTDHDETLDGGAGNDLLIGDNGDDTYVFGYGYGNDTIEERTSHLLGIGVDLVSFDASVSVEDVILERPADRENLVIRLAGSVDTLTIKDTFTENWVGNTLDWIDEFHFADGTVWTLAEVRDTLITQATSAGDDLITGFYTDDTLDGGAGNDRLEAGDGHDTYVFNRGYGNDIVRDISLFGSGQNNDGDAVTFGAGVLPGDVAVSRVGNSDDIILTIADTGETLTIENQNNRGQTGGGEYEIEEIRFENGTVWTASEIRSRLITEAQSSGDDTVYGFFSEDTLDGGAGNDTLNGGDGGDTYVFDVGYGTDVVHDERSLILRDGVDKISFGPGITTSNIVLARVGDDLIITVTGFTDQLTVQGQFVGGPLSSSIEEFHFSDATVWTDDYFEAVAQGIDPNAVTYGTDASETINGTNGDDIIDGQGGDDTIKGGYGSDIYLYTSGDGNDIIDEFSADAADVDKLIFSDLNAGDLEFTRVLSNLDDLKITITATGESILVDDQFENGGVYALEQVQFADGSAWDSAAIIANAWIRGTASAETIDGTNDDNVIDGQGGDDTINGRFGSDIYLYVSGDGNDLIDERGADTDSDKLKFTDLNFADVTFARSAGNSLDMEITVTANGEVITVDDQFNGAIYAMEAIEFADGSIVNPFNLPDLASHVGTAGDETVSGSNFSADILYGKGGDDILIGRNYSDTYLYGSGDGNDVIDESGAAGNQDRLVFLDLNAGDVTFTRLQSNTNDLQITVNSSGETIRVDDQFRSASYALETIEFADGTKWDAATIQQNAWYRGTSVADTVSGTDDDETFDAGAGDDSLTGGAGSDTFVFKPGLGNDTITDFQAGAASDDIIELRGLGYTDLAGVLADTQQVGADTVIDIDASNSITLVGVNLANLHDDDFQFVA